MANLLIIETSTQTCSLSLSIDGNLIITKICTNKNSHSSLLGGFILEAIEYTNKNNIKINAIVVSSGPGSYTGLRIGVSEAKGLCYGFNIPLIAIPTLKNITFQVIHDSSSFLLKNLIFCPMIDSKRMEVFTALYDKNINELCAPKATIINNNSYKEYLKTNNIVFFGNGSDKCKNIIKSPNAIFIRDIYPTTKSMTFLAEIAFNEKKFEDIIYFEPFYIKEFQTSITQHSYIK